MGRVKIEFTGDKSQLEASYRDLAAAHAKLENQVAKLSVTAAKGHKDGVRGQSQLNASVNSGIKAVAGMVSGWLSVGSAMSLVNSELTDFAKRGEVAAETMKGIAKAQATLALNTLNMQLFKGTESDVANIVKDTGFGDRAQMIEASATAMSAAGGDRKTAMEGLRTAATLTQNSPELLSPLASAAIDISRTTGATSDESMSLALSAGKAGRVTDPLKSATTYSRGIAGIVASSRGDVKKAGEQAAEMVSGLSAGMKDRTGEQSSTSAMSLSAQMDKFFQEGVEQTVRGRKIVTKPDFDPGLPRDRLEYLQANAKERDSFLENYHGEAGYESFIKRAITDPNSVEAKQLLGTVADVGYDTQTLRDAQKLVKGATPEMVLSTQANASKGIVSTMQGAQTMAARQAEVARIVNETRDSAAGYTNQDWLLRTVHARKFALRSFFAGGKDGGDNPEERGAGELEATREHIVRNFLSGGGAGGFAGQKRKELSGVSPEQIRNELLQQMPKDVRAQYEGVDSQIKNLRASEQRYRDLDDGSRGPAGSRGNLGQPGAGRGVSYYGPPPDATTLMHRGGDVVATTLKNTEQTQNRLLSATEKQNSLMEKQNAMMERQEQLQREQINQENDRRPGPTGTARAQIGRQAER